MTAFGCAGIAGGKFGSKAISGNLGAPVGSKPLDLQESRSIPLEGKQSELEKESPIGPEASPAAYEVNCSLFFNFITGRHVQTQAERDKGLAAACNGKVSNMLTRG